MGDPGVKRGLRFFQQADVAEAGRCGRFMREAARHFVEGGGHCQYHLAIVQRRAGCLRRQVMLGGMTQMFQIAARRLEGRQLAIGQIRLPGQDRRMAVDVRIAQPGLGRRHQPVRHQRTAFAGESADHRIRIGSAVPGQVETAGCIFPRRRNVEGGGQQMAFPHHARGEDLRDIDAMGSAAVHRAQCQAGIGGAEVDAETVFLAHDEFLVRRWR